jgi:activator of HSP90 ATPase
MAKVGEEDDRWIVKDMGEQGKNVNNWHWAEQNVWPWCKEKIISTLGDLLMIEKEKLVCRITSVNVTGEATIYNRKGKLKTFYEIDVTMEWTGTMSDSEKVIGKVEKGVITIPTMTDDQSLDDLVVKFENIKDLNDSGMRVYRLAEKSGVSIIKDKISLILTELRNGGKFASSNPSSTDVSPIIVKKDVFKYIPSNVSNSKSFVDIQLKHNFAAPPSEVFECFVDVNRIQAYTRSGAKMSRKEGESFVLYNGSVTGSIVEIVPGTRPFLHGDNSI